MVHTHKHTFSYSIFIYIYIGIMLFHVFSFIFINTCDDIDISLYQIKWSCNLTTRDPQEPWGAQKGQCMHMYWNRYACVLFTHIPMNYEFKDFLFVRRNCIGWICSKLCIWIIKCSYNRIHFMSVKLHMILFMQIQDIVTDGSSYIFWVLSFQLQHIVNFGRYVLIRYHTVTKIII